MAKDSIIRRAGNAEHAGLSELMMRAMRHGGRAAYGPELMEAWTAKGNKVFNHALARYLFVAEAGGKILGFGGWRPEIQRKTVARLASVFIEPGEEGQGLGSKILGAIIEDMRVAGFESARLYAMVNAHIFYLRHGFEDVEWTEIPVAEGLQARVVIMARLL